MFGGRVREHRARISKGAQTQAIVGCRHQPATRLQHPRHLYDSISRRVQPGDYADRDDQLKAGVLEWQRVHVSDPDGHTLVEPTHTQLLCGRINHPGARVDRMNGQTATRQLNSQVPGAAADLQHWSPRRESRSVNIFQHRQLPSLVNDSLQICIAIDPVPVCYGRVEVGIDIRLRVLTYRLAARGSSNDFVVKSLHSFRRLLPSSTGQRLGARVYPSFPYLQTGMPGAASMTSDRHRAFGDIDTTTPILVFGLGPGELHHGALGIARSAGRLGIPVHRLARERATPITLSRYNRSWTQVPSDASTEQVLELMHETVQRIGRPLLVPVDDAGSVFVDQNVEQLPDHLFPRQPAGLARRLSSKQGMYDLCQSHDIPSPQSAFPADEREALALCEQWQFPIVLKCINAGEAPPGSPRVVIARDLGQLVEAYRAMEVVGVANVMFQEYVPGTPETIWMFNGYFDANSDCKVGFTGRKIRQSPPYTGATTLGVCEANDHVLEMTLRFMKEIGYRGIVDMGYRFDERDGRYKLLDVNPRIGATFRLFVGPDGTDVLRAMYLDLTDQQVPATSLQQGRRWLVEHMDLSSSLIYHGRGDLTVTGWLRSFRGVREAAWFATDDPLPFFALWLRLIFKRAPQRLRRWLRREPSFV